MKIKEAGCLLAHYRSASFSHDLDAIMYYFNTDTCYKNAPISLPGDLKDMATIFTRLTLLLVGADACTPHIINSVWRGG
jgi:hypothetical protein